MDGGFKKTIENRIKDAAEATFDNVVQLRADMAKVVGVVCGDPVDQNDPVDVEMAISEASNLRVKQRLVQERLKVVGPIAKAKAKAYSTAAKEAATTAKAESTAAKAKAKAESTAAKAAAKTKSTAAKAAAKTKGKKRKAEEELIQETVYGVGRGSCKSGRDAH